MQGVIIPKASQNIYPFVSISQGSIFGEVDILFFNERRKYTFHTQTPVEMLVLSKKDFKQIFWLDFRVVGHEVYQKAEKKAKSFRLLYNQKLNSIKNNEDPINCSIPVS